MRYEELITELWLLKRQKKDAEGIFDNTDEISNIIDNIKIPIHKREKLNRFISLFMVIQRQDFI